MYSLVKMFHFLIQKSERQKNFKTHKKTPSPLVIPVAHFVSRGHNQNKLIVCTAKQISQRNRAFTTSEMCSFQNSYFKTVFKKGGKILYNHENGV